MERPNYNFEPIEPSMKSPVPSTANDVCGSNFHIEVEVRVPYQKIDKYVNVLPIIYEYYEVLSSDLNESLPRLASSEFQNKLQDAIAGAQELLNNYWNADFMDKGNRDSIQKMISRAQEYLDKAKKIQTYWNQYNPDSPKGPTGWPLEQEKFGSGCDYKVAPEKGSIFTFGQGDKGAQSVSFTCPTQESKTNHEKDRAMFRKLLVAALRNCRCAQEAAAAVGTYMRNKAEASATAGTLQYTPKTATPKRAIPMMPTPDEEPEVEEEAEAPAPTKKKKDNTLLIAGAAALGLLMLKR